MINPTRFSCRFCSVLTGTILLASFLTVSFERTGQAADSSRKNSTPDLTILPVKFTLTGPKSAQSLLLGKTLNGEFTGQITGGVFKSSDEKIVKVQSGIAIPVGDGTATITVKFGQQTAVTRVTVTGRKNLSFPVFATTSNLFYRKPAVTQGPATEPHPEKMDSNFRYAVTILKPIFV
jgi:hypothetical protein